MSIENLHAVFGIDGVKSILCERKAVNPMGNGRGSPERAIGWPDGWNGGAKNDTVKQVGEFLLKNRRIDLGSTRSNQEGAVIREAA